MRPAKSARRIDRQSNRKNSALDPDGVGVCAAPKDSERYSIALTYRGRTIPRKADSVARGTNHAGRPTVTNQTKTPGLQFL